ncbi:14 kDa phosphohistidine phosphatase-like isoform X2 [Halichondria panicea]
MDSVNDVMIDEDGVFKYILIELCEKKRGGSGSGEQRKKLIIRGFEWAEFHADILDRVSPKFDQLGLTYECLGGGRIRHDKQQQSIHIYGYSVGFGQADHGKAQELVCLKYDYPEANITWSNSGY